MSQNTNKIFWVSALAIVFVALGLFIFNSVGEPVKHLYNNGNSETLCNSLYKENLLTCLDASSNTEQGQHSSSTSTWIDQISNKSSLLTGFDHNDKSGWDDTSLLFDGENDVLNAQFDNTKINENMSLLMNIKILKKPTSTKYLVSNDAFKIKLNTNGSIEVSVTGNKTVTLSSTGSLETNAWYSLMIVYDNDLLKLFINGQLNNQVEANLGNINPNNTAVIGSGINMKLSSFAIWDGILEESQVNQNTVALNNKTLDIDKYIIDFKYTGDCKPWSVPLDGEYQVELWGAQGSGTNGGSGAYTSGNITLKKGEVLYVCVGNGGGTNTTNFNGGGSGKYAGGGATDIRLSYNNNALNFDSTKTRIMVAAGGGASDGSKGGAGGTETGANGSVVSAGLISPTGGKQKLGGSKALKKDGFGTEVDIYTKGNNGAFAQGGNSSNSAGGGAGYFGGGSITNGGGAAGGSSYISYEQNEFGLHAASTANNLLFTLGGHYSGYVFTSPKMISGNDMIIDPITGAETKGKTGTGHARITLIDAKKEVTVKVPTSISYEQPGKPSFINSTITENSASIKFTSVDYGQSYRCYYGLSKDAINNEGVITSVVGQTQQCNFKNLAQNTTHYYKLVAINGNKETESDIYEFKTKYKTPTQAALKMSEATDKKISISFETDLISTDYVCYLGTSKDAQNEAGIMTKVDNVVTCTFEGLEQSTPYYVSLKTINGDKSSTSETIALNTDYATPEKSELISYESTEDSINLIYGPVEYYTDAKCYYGTSDKDVNNEIKTEVSGGNIYCSIDGLTQGSVYYFKVVVSNNEKVHESEISSAITKYASPKAPVLVDKSSTSNSITVNYDITENSSFKDATYICSYGTKEDEINKTGSVVNKLDGTVSCEYNSLIQNNSYYTRIGVKNGDKVVYADTVIAKTDYQAPNAPVYNTSSVDDNNNITAVYNISDTSYSYTCYLSETSGGTDKKGVATVDSDNKLLTCKFTGILGGSDNYFFVRAKNGEYTTDSSVKKIYVNESIPTLTVTIDGNQFNSSGWAKNDIVVNAVTESKIPAQVQALAICRDSAKCTPSYTASKEQEGTTYTAANAKTEIIHSTSENINETVKITAEGKTNYICMQILTENKATETECFGPYKLDKTAPKFSGSNVTIADTVSTYDVYNGLTITDNLGTITKSYDKLPTWGNSGTYTVKYTATDEAGNTNTFTRTFTITLTNFSITYNLNSGSISGQKTSYNKKTDAFTLPTPTRTGYTFSGWTGTGLSSKTKTVTVPKGSSGNRSYTANWDINTYSISYNNNGGSGSGTTSYNVTTNSFNLYTPTRTGYTFTGWTGSNGTTPQKTVTIAKGSTGNKSYTANWQVNQYTVDVNPIIQGTTYGGGLASFTFDVYVDGVLKANDVTDWAQGVNYGSTVRVIANGRAGYNITANGDQTATVGTSGLTFSPTWTDNIAPVVHSYNWTNYGGGAGYIQASVTEEGSGVVKTCHKMQGASGMYGTCWDDGRLGDSWNSITVFGNKTFYFEVWDAAGNYTTFSAVHYVYN